MTDTKVYTADAHQVLGEFCPSLAHALGHTKNNVIPDSLVDLLLTMVDVVKTTHPSIDFKSAAPNTVPHIPASITNLPKSHLQPSMSQEAWLTHLKKVVQQVQQSHIPLSTGFDLATLQDKYIVLSELNSSLSGMFYPNWPKIRTLPRLAGIDPTLSTKAPEWTDPQESVTEAELFCVKEEKKNYDSQRHTAGLFVASCVHGVCYGFHHMVQPEGRKDLLKVLYERFPKEVLDCVHILYDFNCQAGEYMYNRFPDLFSAIRLFIDRFHAAFHKCADVFKL